MDYPTVDQRFKTKLRESGMTAQLAPACRSLSRHLGIESTNRVESISL